MDFLQIVKTVGDKTSWITSKVTEFLSSLLSIPVTDLQSKLITLILLFLLFYLFLSVITIARKPIKWILIILSVLLFLSVLASLFI